MTPILVIIKLIYLQNRFLLWHFENTSIVLEYAIYMTYKKDYVYQGKITKIIHSLRDSYYHST